MQSKERLSNNFFQRFYPWCRAHGIEIDEGVERSQDQKRAVKMTEATPSCGGIGGSHWWRVSASIILGSGSSAVLCVSVLPCDSWVSVGHLSSIVVIYGCSGSVHLSESHSQTLAGICNSRPNFKINPFPAVVIVHRIYDQEWCLVLRAVPTAPVTPAHRSKAPGGRDWVFPRGPKASLGSFRRSARTLALAVRVV